MTTTTKPNGVSTAYEYDGLSRLTRLKHTKDTTTHFDYNYAYNTANQITGITEPSVARTFGYDSVDRLTSATMTGQSNETYVYDVVGNRTSSNTNSTAYTYSYPSFNRLSSRTSTALTSNYTHDANGNLTSKLDPTVTDPNAKWYFSYDAENRLVRATKFGFGSLASRSVVYQYDALGRRVVRQDKKTGRTEFTHDGLDVLQDRFNKFDGTATTTNYVNGLGIDNKLKQSIGTTSKYFLTDHLGSTVGMADSNGAVAESATYDSFGNKLSSNLTTRYQYTGREYDEYTGLMFYRARFYDPQIGRFISEDPIEFEGGRNWYVYAENSPLNYTDPLGLEVIILFYRKQGVLKVWDLDKGDWFERFNNPDLVIEAFSGDGDCKNQTSCDAEKDKGPIPLGRYAIDGGPNTGGVGWRKTSFRLFRRVRDSKDGEEFSHEYVPIQDRNDPSKTVPRGGFYIHTGNYSIGCVTVPVLKKDDYNKLSDMLKNTSKGTFINASDPKNPKKRKGSGYLFVY